MSRVSFTIVSTLSPIYCCSDSQLLPEELARRTLATSNTSAHINPTWYHSPDEIKRRLAQYAQEWKLNPAILVANLNRVINIIPLLQLHSFVGRLQEARGFELATKEWYWAVEFYLQMDSQ